VRPRLGVNVDHIATIRQARRTVYPDPVEAAFIAERAGADQITIHLREDRRHIQERDVAIMRKTVTTELNLEMASTQEMVAVALKYSPDTVTLVPERREELTTEGGLDVNQHKDQLHRSIRLLQEGNIRVALFIDPDLDQVRAAHKIDAHAIEIHTGRYCEARGFKERHDELTRIQNAAKAASKLGLGVAAGHGLHYQNTIPVARILEIQELNIGHAIVARAMIAGMETAVRDMLAVLRESRVAAT
jgi:pyridoxine 5-phosphate synthase